MDFEGNFFAMLKYRPKENEMVGQLLHARLPEYSFRAKAKCIIAFRKRCVSELIFKNAFNNMI